MSLLSSHSLVLASRKLRDREEIPQVLFVFPSEKGGRGLRPAGNTKPEEKLEENGWRGGGGMDN